MRFFALSLCVCASVALSIAGVRAEPGDPAPAPVVQPVAAPEVAPPEVSVPAPVEDTAAVAAPAEQAATSPVAPSTPELVELSARIQALERIDPLDDSVRRPVDFAKAALERSRASRNLGDLPAEARTRQLARAAVELAEARMRLLRERALFQATQARRNISLAEQATAKRAAEHERARALELQRESAAP